MDLRSDGVGREAVRYERRETRAESGGLQKERRRVIVCTRLVLVETESGEAEKRRRRGRDIVYSLD